MRNYLLSLLPQAKNKKTTRILKWRDYKICSLIFEWLMHFFFLLLFQRWISFKLFLCVCFLEMPFSISFSFSKITCIFFISNAVTESGSGVTLNISIMLLKSLCSFQEMRSIFFHLQKACFPRQHTKLSFSIKTQSLIFEKHFCWMNNSIKNN